MKHYRLVVGGSWRESASSISMQAFSERWQSEGTRRHEDLNENRQERVYDKQEEMNRSITRLSGIASTLTRGFRSTAFVAMPIKVRSFAILVYPQFLSNASIGAAQNFFTVHTMRERWIPTVMTRVNYQDRMCSHGRSLFQYHRGPFAK